MARTILFPTDGSKTARAAGRVVADIAKGEGDSVLVLAVTQRADVAGVEDRAVTSGISEYLREVAEAEAQALLAKGVRSTWEVVTADSEYEAIVAKAREIQADFIVMGTHGRTGFARAVIGSVADRVVRHSDVPVILVPLGEKGD